MEGPGLKSAVAGRPKSWRLLRLGVAGAPALPPTRVLPPPPRWGAADPARRRPSTRLVPPARPPQSERGAAPAAPVRPRSDLPRRDAWPLRWRATGEVCRSGRRSRRQLCSLSPADPGSGPKFRVRTTQARFPVEQSVTLAADRQVPLRGRGHDWMSTLRSFSLGRMISANRTCRDSLL
jgi:hypothetical protein